MPVASAAVPADGVGAVVATVALTDALGPGYITAYPTGQPRPLASNLNAEEAGHTIANHVTVGVGVGPAFDLYTQSGTHLVADIVGWYLDGS